MTLKKRIYLVMALTTLLFYLAGCYSVPHGGQHFVVDFKGVDQGSPLPGPLAVLEEVYRIEEVPDGPSHYSQKLQQARIFYSSDGGFTADSPAMTDHFIWAFNNRLEYRWTVFTPGFIVTTFYPEGYFGFWWNPDTGFSSTRMVEIGWRKSRYVPLGSIGYGVPTGFVHEYPATAQRVSLALPLRPLGTDRPVFLPEFAKTLPASLTNEDARNFYDQMHTLAVALEKIGPQEIDPERRRLIWEALEQQQRAILRAGYGVGELGEVRNDTLEERIARVRHLLSIEEASGMQK
jgi:hypothetical protein